MARDSRSRSPAHRERPRHADDRYRESGKRHRDDNKHWERERDEQSDRRRSSTKDAEAGGYRRRERDRSRDRGPGYDGRGPRYERDRERDDGRGDGRDGGGRRTRDRSRDRDRQPSRDKSRDRDRKRPRVDGDNNFNHRAGPSTATALRSPISRSRRSSRPRSKSPPPRDSRPRSHPRSPSPAVDDDEDKDKDKGKPNFGQSGLLAAATNTVRHADGTATILKYNEPPEARKPTVGWRLYVFKGKEQTDMLHIQRQSCYLIGRDKAVADIYIEHPSCSKQHAVIQYRQVYDKDEFGTSKAVIKPFIIDLESTNGTHVNDEKIPVSRYYELKIGDGIKFGQSTREYVLLHDDV